MQDSWNAGNEETCSLQILRKTQICVKSAPGDVGWAEQQTTGTLRMLAAAWPDKEGAEVIIHGSKRAHGLIGRVTYCSLVDHHLET